MVICLFAMLAHIAILSTIYKRNNLASKRYRIVANISACDCCYCLFALIMIVRGYGRWIYNQRRDIPYINGIYYDFIPSISAVYMSPDN